MKNLLIAFGLVLSACGGSKASNQSTVAAETGGDAQPEVDPTVPSWAPQTCIAYHRAVVQAVDCAAVAQGKRDEIRDKYAADSAAWKTTDATPAKVDEIKGYCETETASVRAAIGASCVR
jgi:hypothetical protein